MEVYTKEQLDSLKKLRSRIEHLLPEHFKPDHDLIRWLKARNYDVDKAEEMLKKSLQWRELWKIDDILSYEPPEVLKKFYAVGKTGYDKEGYPVWIIPYGGNDCKGLLQSASQEDFIRYTVWTIEVGPKTHDLQIKNKDNITYRQSVIFDLNSFSVRHFTWKPVIDAIIEIIKIYEANYPENLKEAFVINAPVLFQALFAVVKSVIAEETIEKIHVFGSRGWKEALLKKIDPEQLPVHYGGTMVDPDGNPRCESKICYGGEVPKSYYLSNKKNDNLQKPNFKTIMAKNTASLEFDVKKSGQKLVWEFNANNDFRFNIKRLEGQKEETVIDNTTISANIEEEGYFICEKTGKYKVNFECEKPTEINHNVHIEA